MKQNHGCFSADVPTGDSWAEVVLAVNSTTCTGSPLKHFLPPLTLRSSSTWPSLQPRHWKGVLLSMSTAIKHIVLYQRDLSSLMKRRTSCSTTTPPTTALEMIQWLKLSQRLVGTKRHASVQLQRENWERLTGRRSTSPTMCVWAEPSPAPFQLVTRQSCSVRSVRFSRQTHFSMFSVNPAHSCNWVSQCHVWSHAA